jgi:GxxExxY protein
MPELLHGGVSFEIIGAAMEVHRELGPGFLESVYQRAMETELRHRGVPFESQYRIPLTYKGCVLGEHVLDLVVDGRVVAELKAVRELNEQHRAQLISYLKASQLPVGLLINFAKVSVEHRRVLLSDSLKTPAPQSV